MHFAIIIGMYKPYWIINIWSSLFYCIIFIILKIYRKFIFVVGYYTFSKLNNPTNVLLLMFELSCIFKHIFWNLNIWIIKIWIPLIIKFQPFSMDRLFQTSFSICVQNVFCVCGLIKHALKVQTTYKEMSTHFDFLKK